MTEIADPFGEQSLSAFLSALDAEREDEVQRLVEFATSNNYTELLYTAHSHYTVTTEFTTGSLVQWKPMMRNRHFPADGMPAIVVRYLKGAGDYDSDGDPIVEPADLIVGIVDPDEIFRLVPVTSARMMHFQP